MTQNVWYWNQLEREAGNLNMRVRYVKYDLTTIGASKKHYIPKVIKFCDAKNALKSSMK